MSERESKPAGPSDSSDVPREIVEALLFAADEPLTARRLAGLIENASPAMVEDMIRELNSDYIRERRAFRVQPVAGGYQFVTRAAFAPWIRQLHASAGEPRLSQAALETLAIVAYKQPVTRLELEAIRGVSVDGVLRTLIDRDLVTIAGRAESLGRPLLYGTTPHFLEYFGLPGLEALPRPEELQVLFADREREDAAGAETGDDSGTPQ